MAPAHAASRFRKTSKHSRIRTSRTDSRTDRSETKVRLRYFNSTWAKVLRNFAEATDSTLVMHDVPPGRFSRKDRTRYTRGEAIRILNHELEPKGFRILEKDEFLMVLHLNRVRRRYRRPITSDRSESQRSSDSPGEPRRLRNRTRTVRSGGRLRQSSRAFDERDNPIRRASHSDEPDAETDKSSKPRARSEAGRLTTKTIRPKHKSARGLALTVFRAFKPRAELVDKGPNGLPAFRVYRANIGAGGRNANRETLFTVGIDTDRDELIVEAPRSVVDDVSGLIRALDAPPNKKNRTVQIVSAPKKTLRVARKLEPNLKQLFALRAKAKLSRTLAMNDKTKIAQNDKAAAGNAPKDAQPGEKDAGNGDKLKKPPAGDGSIDGLKGEVRIQSMDDLGVFIIEGNEHDVALMRKIIKEIELLSLGAIPEIHLKPLKHVNSLPLSTLLNSVYEKLTAQSAQGGASRQLVNFFPIVKPNAILLVAPTDDLQAILEVVDQLDQPVDPESEFQVFALKNAIASQMVALISEFYEERQGLGTSVRVVADVRTNSVIVQARPSDLKELGALIERIDKGEIGAVARMHIFRLRHAGAEDLANVINGALQSILNPASSVTSGQRGGTQGSGSQRSSGPGGGQSSQQIQQSKSVILEFLAIDGDEQRVVRSGILSDIRVTADLRLNALVVTAPEQSMQLIAALIRQLDQPISTISDIKIYTLKNSDAAAMVELLQSIFGSGSSSGGSDNAVAGIDDADTSIVSLKFSVDSRTNSIIAVGIPGALRVVEAILLRLDESDERQRKPMVIRLKNTQAEAVAEAINDFLSSQRDLAEIDPNLVSKTEMMEREIIAVAEPVTNSLIISVTPRYLKDILELIDKLDEAPQQVIIQALLVEVELRNTDEFGIELGFQDSVLFNRSLVPLDTLTTILETVSNPATGFSSQQQRIISQESTPGFLFNNTGPLGNNGGANSKDVAGQGLSNFSLGRLNGDLGFGGLVLSANSESISVLLRALASRRTIHVLSRPQIRTLDNQEATIHVGQNVPIIQDVTASQNFVTPNIVQQAVGITLTVIPRISPDGSIVMRTEANKSELAGVGVPVFFDTLSNRVIESPIINITEALATVSVRDGQTIVLGGMITKSDNTLERKVPWLGDIPILGRAFRYDSTTTRRTELLIFLTPRIIRSAADSELIKQVEAERMHFIEEEAELLHGPLYGIPSERGQFQGGKMNDIQNRQRSIPPAPTENGNDEAGVPTTVIPAPMRLIRVRDERPIDEQNVDDLRYENENRAPARFSIDVKPSTNRIQSLRTESILNDEY